MAPTVSEGHFSWEGDAIDAEDAFLNWLSEEFPEGSFKLLEFNKSEDQQMELPFSIEKNQLN